VQEKIADLSCPHIEDHRRRFVEDFMISSSVTFICNSYPARKQHSSDNMPPSAELMTGTVIENAVFIERMAIQSLPITTGKRPVPNR
jgi:hypothetical protein